MPIQIIKQTWGREIKKITFERKKRKENLPSTRFSLKKYDLRIFKVIEEKECYVSQETTYRA